MEGLNSKLWEKYQHLKKRKVADLEWSSKQDASFKKYQLATEELIAALKKENDDLRYQLSLEEENCAECQMRLMEEKRKAEELSHEVERLNNLLSTRNHLVSEGGNSGTVTLNSPFRSPKVISRNSPKIPSPKMIVDVSNDQRGAQNGEIIVSPSAQQGMSGPTNESFQPGCCKMNITSSGDDSENIFKCVFQTLVESLVGAKFSVDSQTEQPYLSVIHQSSGYSFRLTWLKRIDGEEGGWFYRVLSLGTLERVALEWMREDIMFSSAMCPIFFERVSRIVGRCH